MASWNLRRGLLEHVTAYACRNIHECMAEMAMLAETDPEVHPAISRWWGGVTELLGGVSP
jgi:hypothetical protein